MKIEKTNAMRILDKEKIAYHFHTYEHGDEAIDGESVAELLQQDPDKVFKTLVCVSKQRAYYIFVIPVNQELDLKKCAQAVHEKSVELIPVKDITKVSGYVRGGCSPIGMKKQYPTVFHESSLLLDTIIFSGGKIGLQIEMVPSVLLTLVKAQTYDIVKTLS